METRIHYKVCPFCEAGCGLELTLSGEKVVQVRGDKAHVLSRGFCCPKGIALKEFHEDPDRLRMPVIRERGGFRTVDWDTAFRKVEEGLGRVRAAHGKNSVALYLGNPNTHTMAGALFMALLIRALQTRNIYTASSVDQIPKQTACGFLYGSPVAIPVPDIDRTKLFVIFGGNPLVSGGSLMTAPDMRRRIRELQERGGTCIVIDPMRTRTAEVSDIHLPILPGTDVYLLLGLIRHLFEKNAIRTEAFGERLRNLEALKKAVSPFTLERAARVCAMKPEAVQDLADRIAFTRPSALYGRMGTSVTAHGTLASWAIEVLNLLTGNLDAPGGTGFPLAAHMQAKAASRKGFVTGRWHSRVSGAPEVMGELPASVLAEEMETPGEGQIRMLITVAGNPVIALPESGRVDAAISELDFHVAVDYYINDTSRHADVILPPTSPLSQGHYDFVFHGFSVRNTAVYSAPVFPVPEGEKAKWEILARLALLAEGKGGDTSPELVEGRILEGLADKVVAALGEKSGVTAGMLIQGLTPPPGPERILDFLLKIGPYGDAFGMKPQGLSFEKLAALPHGLDLGPLKSRLKDVLATPDGCMDLLPEILAEDIRRLDRAEERMHRADRPFLLIGRRQLRTNNSWMHNLPSLLKGSRCTLMVHPEDARNLNLKEGGMAEVSSDAGSLEVPVTLSERIIPGLVSLPHGWGHQYPGARLSVAETHPGVNTNRLTPRAMDPVSGNAVLNGIPVSIQPVSDEKGEHA
jgi:anaerobic selenocysteine-containing dehydrogenase